MEGLDFLLHSSMLLSIELVGVGSGPLLSLNNVLPPNIKARKETYNEPDH